MPKRPEPGLGVGRCMTALTGDCFYRSCPDHDRRLRNCLQSDLFDAVLGIDDPPDAVDKNKSVPLRTGPIYSGSGFLGVGGNDEPRNFSVQVHPDADLTARAGTATPPAGSAVRASSQERFE